MVSGQRKKAISRRGFNCSCPVCSSPEEEAMSDRNRERIQEILIAFRHPEKRTAANVDSAAVEVFQILEAEAIHAQEGEFAALFAELYREIGDTKKARDMARLSTEKRIWHNGADSERAEKAREFFRGFQ
jgi:hypothetical protein